MSEITQGKIEERTFFSHSLAEEMTLIVYYPPGYSTLYKYQLLIAQDGRDYFNLGRIHRAADALSHEGKIQDTIIVGIPYKDVEDRRQKYHPNGDKHPLYLRFLANELVPYLDEEFPTYQMGRTRALIGDSLGATVSLLCGLSYPNTFSKIIMQSPYVNRNVIDQVNACKDPSLLELYHVIGKSETEVKTTDGKVLDFLQPNRELHALFNKKGFEHFYEEFEGNHTWTYWQPDLHRALSMMLSD